MTDDKAVLVRNGLMRCPEREKCRATLVTYGFGRGRKGESGQVLEGIRCDCEWAKQQAAREA